MNPELEQAKVMSIAKDINKYLETLGVQPFLVMSSLIVLLGSNIDVTQSLLEQAKVAKDNPLRNDLDSLRRKLWAIKCDIFQIHIELKKKESNC